MKVFQEGGFSTFDFVSYELPNPSHHEDTDRCLPQSNPRQTINYRHNGGEANCNGNVASYCTAGTTTNGCNATVTATGTPSASAATGFDITIGNVEGSKQGIVFWGTRPRATSWGSGSSFLCVGTPLKRTGVQGSGGTSGSCNGSLTLDFNAWMVSHPFSAPPSGTQVYLQGWFRDPPAPKTTSLSNGLVFTVCP